MIKVIIKSVIGFALASLFLLVAPQVASAADDWKTSFNDICSKVQASDNLSIQDFSTLLERTDKLMPEIQASDDRSKKVYMQRLKKCRSFFEFMIDTKKNPGQ